MRFLIAGLGSIGRRHMRNLVALGETDIVLLRTHRATLPDADLAGYPVDDVKIEPLIVGAAVASRIVHVPLPVPEGEGVDRVPFR